MRTLVKFIDNYNEKSRNKIITRTLGKLGVVDSSCLAQMQEKPRPREFWYCDIVKETGAGTPTGVFTLAPVKKIPTIVQDGYEFVDVVHIIPGMYESVRKNDVVLLVPKAKGPHWIVSNVLRDFLMGRSKKALEVNGQQYGANAVIVVFDNTVEWKRE